MEKPVASRAASGVLLEHRDGVSDYVHFDRSDNTFTHEIAQDVEPFLDHVKALRLEHGANVGKSKSGDMYLAGSFPPVLVNSWLNLRGLTMKDFKDDVLKEFLNDSNHSAFRVWPGKV